MISVNFTLIVELVLFLVFLGVSYRIAWRPLLGLMHTRRQKVDSDTNEAEVNRAAAQHLVDAHRARLSETDQRAAKQVYDATYRAHVERRNLIAELKNQADMELAAHRDALQKQLLEQRKRFPEFLPALIEAMDHQLKQGGSLL